MKELAAISVNEFDGADADTIIKNLDNELVEILKCADVSVKAAQDHVNERLLNGEDESRAATILSSELSIKSNDVKSVIANSSKKNSNSEKQQDVEAANEKLRLLEEEQCELEEDLQRKANACDINRQRIEDARSIVLLNEARLKENETQEKTNSIHKQELPSSKICQADTPHKLPKDLSSPSQTTVKLKGVQLPTFSGEDKSEFEAWKAAFTSVVDDSVMPVKEKMLRLLGCLSGKARETVKDLGFSIYRILVALREDDPDGELKSNHLSLAVKEKLPEDYVRDYKYWLLEQTKQDRFENLVEWIETRVRIMEEAREETGDYQKRNDQRQDGRKLHRGFNTSGKVRTCIVPKCKIDHLPWVCEHFKELPVSQRKQLIARSGRCFRCLAVGHQSRNCARNRECGVGECKSTRHSSYLHEPDRSSMTDKRDPITGAPGAHSIHQTQGNRKKFQQKVPDYLMARMKQPQRNKIEPMPTFHPRVSPAKWNVYP